MVDAAHQNGIQDKALVAWVQERLQLKELGLTGEAFTSVAKALAQAGELDSEALDDHLQQYSSLQDAVHALTEAKSLLKEEVKKQAGNKLKLEEELEGLEANIESTRKTNEHLENEWQDLNTVFTELQHETTSLKKEIPDLRKEKLELMGQLVDIEKQIVQEDHKLKGLKEGVSDSDVKVKAAGYNYTTFQTPMKIVNDAGKPGASPTTEDFGEIFRTARAVAEDPGAFLASLISTQRGTPINVVECNNCGVRLIMVKQGIVDQQLVSSPTKCPDCGESALAVVETVLSVGGKGGKIITAKPVQKPDIDNGTTD